ncbi:methyltransferase domain-containing protein [Antrihabitans cavernicola]|uniref:methyltransferase domain-containing protein n=1 Tax=Antrihabitans cavernicola TaxID=2495913 RepID=UPI0016599FAB|nr:methyltransferase domain-containing protein [Spelaeibacter cavernicola]
MDRIGQLLKFIDKSKVGIEVAPYHSPIVSRSDGFQSISLDIFDADELRRRAEADPEVPDANVKRIEEVDLQGSAGDIADLVSAKFGDKRFDYILSSHNFEHLPDPIRFLQGCQQVLADGGVLSLAVPDRRFCFDFYRPVTELSEWLDAFHEKRQRPTPGQVFRGTALRSNLNGGGAWGALLTPVPTPDENIEDAYAKWQSMQGGTDVEYTDAHCSAFTPASLELMLADLRFLGLIRLETIEISQPNVFEFYVHLRNVDAAPSSTDTTSFYRNRAEIMQRAAAEVGNRSPIAWLIHTAGTQVVSTGSRLITAGSRMISGK